ncbi:hypothetical protein [Saccharopolyspora elongata]|uniref:Uncharacterized protein n=1 Tax=Saccharopolyspora elongata TaxID=2530387 RepID=A0A4R4YWA8_9PSEU|nr:hypothetical protein [Saccharopolyspora elongata]TDD48649.1 hypothetical protein E1288_22030 [Saccharopolyspora elongata]
MSSTGPALGPSRSSCIPVRGPPDNVLAAMTDLDSPAPPRWVPSGLDRRPPRFAGSLCTARVLDLSPTT